MEKIEPLQECTCPALSKCNWLGYNVYHHYQEKHPELITTHPYTILPNIKRDFETHQIFKFNGFQFLLQLKCTVLKYKLWHCIIYIGDPKIAELFKYKLEYKSENGSIIKYKNVQKQERRFTMHKEDSIEVTISSLFRELGDYDKINFTISLNILKKQCSSCKNLLSEYPVRCLMDKYYCHQCTKNIFCNNFDKGCTFYLMSDIFEKKKHEEWYCKYSNYYCDNCEKNIEDETWMYHRTRCFKAFKEFLIDSNVMTHSNVLKVDEFYYAILKCFETTFYCKWRVGRFGNINITIHTGENKKIKFDCLLKFNTIFDSEIVLDVSQNKQKFWSLDLTAAESELEDVIVENKYYNMILEIDRHKIKKIPVKNKSLY